MPTRRMVKAFRPEGRHYFFRRVIMPFMSHRDRQKPMPVSGQR